MALQADGKIVVGGSSMALSRYSSTGHLDTGFGSGGTLSINFSKPTHSSALALQPDGKIVLAGYINNGTSSLTDYDFALARVNSDGSLDTSFGTAGKVTTAFTFNDWGNAVAIQPDGKIVAAGSAQWDYALARYNGDGSLDASFGNDGKVVMDWGTVEGVYAVALQTDGKILAAGIIGASFGLGRYNSDGSLDTSFGTGGTVVTSLGGNDFVTAMALQPDGKILVAGYTIRNGNTDFALVRYTSNGSLDTSFGAGGTVITDFGGEDKARAVALRPNGKIVVAGEIGVNAVLAQYNPDGSLDTNFSDDGKVIADTGGLGGAYGVAVQPDGKVVMAGGTYLIRYESPAPPGIPTLLAPPNGTITTTPDITFAWQAGEGGSPEGYSVQVDSNVITTSDTTFSTTLPIGPHSWTVRAYNSEGYSNWAAPWTVEIRHYYHGYLPLVLRNP